MVANLRTSGVADAVVSAPSAGDLLTVAADVVAMVNDRTTYVTVSTSTGEVGVHVECQADAEHLARLLRLGHVRDYVGSGEHDGFTVWSGSSWPSVEISVYCRIAAQVRPVRAFPERPGEFEHLDTPVPYALAVA